MNNENLIRLNTYETEPIRETYTEGEFLLADYCSPVMRIVRSEAKAFVRSETVYEEKLTVEGAVEFTVIYLSDEGKISSCTQMLPFSHTGEIGFSNDDVFDVCATVSYLNTRALSPQKLYLKAAVEIQVSYVKKVVFPAVVPDLQENVFIKKIAVDSFEILCSGHKPLKVSDELKPEARIVSVLRYDVFFNETEQKILTGKLISKADMLLKIVYLTVDGKISSHEQKVSVSQILDMNGITEDSVCRVKYSLADCRVNVANSGESVNNSIIYELTVNVDAVGYSKCRYLLCSDAFSDRTQIKCKTNSFKSGGFSKVSKEQSFRETFDIGLYDKLYDVSVFPTVLSSDYDKEAERLSVSGTFSCRALYCDENGDVSSVEKEIPFMVPIQLDHISESVVASAEVYINSFAYVENDNSSAELRIDCCCKGFLFDLNSSEIVSEIVSEGDSVVCDSNRMVLYFAEKDEDIWSISKKYRKNPEIIMKTNGLTGEILSEAVMLRI